MTGLCFVHGMGIVHRSEFLNVFNKYFFKKNPHTVSHHRDVKPANILVSCSTNLKGESFDHKTLLNKDVTLQIADFGLSRFLVRFFKNNYFIQYAIKTLLHGMHLN